MATVQDVIDEAEVILQDTANTRYSLVELTKIANYAIFEAYRIRPDLNFGALGSAPAALASSATFPLPPQYEPVVSNYIAGRAELRDAEYATDGRAAALLALFKAALTGA